MAGTSVSYHRWTSSMGSAGPCSLKEICMTASTSLRAPALVARLSRLDGAWAGDVIGPDGALVGRQQVSCAWDATHLTLRVRSCLLSRAGRVLGAEELQISYDPATDRVAARHRQGQGYTERAHVYAGAPD